MNSCRDRVDPVASPIVSAPAVDIERLSLDLGDLAAAHVCPTCMRFPAQRFELLHALGGRLQPSARDRLELVELASHLAWMSR
jgi:hypothetical protein